MRSVYESAKTVLEVRSALPASANASTSTNPKAAANDKNNVKDPTSLSVNDRVSSSFNKFSSSISDYVKNNLSPAANRARAEKEVGGNNFAAKASNARSKFAAVDPRRTDAPKPQASITPTAKAQATAPKVSDGPNPNIDSKTRDKALASDRKSVV